MEEKIKQMIDDAINDNNLTLIDVLFIYAYGYPHKSAKFKQNHDLDFDNIKLINRILVNTIHHNLMVKHDFKQNDTKNVLHVLSKLYDIGFASKYKTFDKEFELLKMILLNRTYEIRTKFIEKQIGDLKDKEQKCIAFILDFAQLGLTTYHYDEEKKESIEIPQLKTEMNLLYWDPTFDKTNKTFHIVTGYKLEKQTKLTFRKKSNLVKIPGFKKVGYEVDEIILWEFGDIAVKSGIGYWIPSISTKRPPNINIDLELPKDSFLFAEKLKTYLPPIENTYAKYLEIAETPKQTISNSDYGNLLEPIGEFDDKVQLTFYEKEIEDFLTLHPEKIEDGLEIIKQQYPTNLGPCDLLCRDRNQNYVVVEFKRDTPSRKVVAQIQGYMQWIKDNIALDKNVRGIIIAKEKDEKLEITAKGSKYKIDIKTFKEDVPIIEETKYCDNCGEVNRKTAKYCVKCGKDFWLE